jgi:hypothetical protein
LLIKNINFNTTMTRIFVFFFWGTENHCHDFVSRHRILRTPTHKLVIYLSISSLTMHLKSWVPIINGIYGGPVLGGFGEYFS